MSPSSPTSDPMEISTPSSSAHNSNYIPSTARSSNGSKESVPNGGEVNGNAGNAAHNASINSNSTNNSGTGDSNSNNSNTTSPATDQQGPSQPSNSAPNASSTSTPAAPSASSGMSMTSTPAAAAAVSQPKIVQTAFIHKLYNMLEDKSIQPLISWSQSGESFVMSPSPEFSKVLASYFKHTNISSFVRQLNMYGFHKVSDVFHTGNPESALWEFKHGNGNFRRGDIVGLREIKRRASRHALVHREYPQKTTQSQPGQPAEPMQPMQPESIDPRMAHLEHNVFDMMNRLQRSEDTSRHLMSSMSRLVDFQQELTSTLGTVASLAGPDHPIHHHMNSLRSHHIEIVRHLREAPQAPPPLPLAQPPHEAPQFPTRQQYFSQIENAPVSPRQMPQDDPRRLNVPRPNYNSYRPQVPSNLSLAIRRPYGSMAAGSTTTTTQPSPLRSQPPPPPPGPHPPANVETPQVNLARRHTSAEIRAPHWPNNPSPYASGPSSGPWPSSPNRPSQNPEDAHIQESLFSYSLQGASSRSRSRPTTPPPPPFSSSTPSSGNVQNNSINNALESFNWSAPSRNERNLSVHEPSAPQTRRGSMAHILNHDNNDQEMRDDPRGEEGPVKRKRL
ncbi:flocculation suppression protein [Zalerion maritima]|uniref:Flocculation suppression protein n=1 Tax=Zalerion maritima TaxID=339359 RepID=A0AAD5WNW2_9PEZI|nr:flocculation suppression protein [Zalerion maritima]